MYLWSKSVGLFLKMPTLLVLLFLICHTVNRASVTKSNAKHTQFTCFSKTVRKKFSRPIKPLPGSYYIILAHSENAESNKTGAKSLATGA